MDEIDTFYQQYDSKQLLDEHGEKLRDEARDILARAPNAKIAGVVLTPDSRESEPVRQALAAATGQPVPPGLLVGTFPRALVENVLVEYAGIEHWQEDAGQPQCVLPVVVSTRDGFRFGFFGLPSST